VRNNGRIPVLTYFHEDYNAALWRAARPKMNQENNKFNKAYLKELSRDLVVMDFRDEEVGLKEKENKGEIQFKKFESLTSVHEILKKILIAYAKDESILRTVSKWFEDVNQIIMTSYLIIEYLQVNL
jgi:chromosome condensin MukBEF complex kleisin-like MukF subunit